MSSMSLASRITERVRATVDGGRAARALPLPPVRFTDDTIALRSWRPSDGLRLAALCDDDEIRRWTSVPGVYRTHEAAGRAAFAEEERLEGRGTHLAITDVHDAVVHGAVDLVLPGPGRELGRISFLLAADARGRGVATRAVALLGDWATGTVGTDRLEIRPQADNAAAIGVAVRAGYVLVDPRPDADGRVLCVRHRAGAPARP